MRIWDEELLLNSGESQPVMDGLLFWMDGRDTLYGTKIGSYAPPAYKPAYMYDRVNNTRINFGDMFGENGVVQESPFVSIITLPDKQGTGQGSVSATISNMISVELVFSSRYFYGSWFGGDANYRRLWYPQTNNGTYTDVLDYSTKPIHIIGTTDENGHPTIYINGAKANVTNPSMVLEPFTKPTIGISVAPFRIGCARAYSRRLTEKEIQHNYNYEKSIGRVTE